MLVTSATVGLTQMVTGMGPIGRLEKGAGLLKGDVSYRIASLFGANLSFMSGSASYMLADGLWGTIESRKSKEAEEGKE